MSTTLPQLFEKDAWRSDIDLAPLLGFCKLSHVAVDGCRLPNLPAPRSADDSVRAPSLKPRNGRNSIEAAGVEFTIHFNFSSNLRD